MTSWKNNNILESRRLVEEVLNPPKKTGKIVARDRKDLVDILDDIYNKYESLIYYDNNYWGHRVPEEIKNLNFIDVSNVKDMSYLFRGQGVPYILSDWDVSNVEDMSHMFEESDFNGDISKWNVSKVKDMSYMFSNNGFFNGDISGWDVSSVKNMSRMFKGSYFDGDISNWDVSNVENMKWMFKDSPLEGEEPSWYKA